MTLIDTHVALWLYAGLAERVPERARRQLSDSGEPRLSPMSALELAYLHEIGRARDSVPVMVAALRKTIGLEVADISLDRLVEAALSLTWTRDPFDRMIAAHSIALDAPLITADRVLLDHLPRAIWN